MNYLLLISLFIYYFLPTTYYLAHLVKYLIKKLWFFNIIKCILCSHIHITYYQLALFLPLIAIGPLKLS
jgi:hypothetical protein